MLSHPNNTLKIIDGPLKVIGFLYGLLGLIFFFVFLFYFYLFLTNFNTTTEIWTSLLLVLGLFLLISSCSFLLTYSFLSLKRWGRYFGIILHALWLVYGLVSFVTPKLQVKNYSLLELIFLIIWPLGIISLLLHPGAKSLFSDSSSPRRNF